LTSLDPAVLTFDCFGTLIDWERGILAALRPLLHARSIDLADNEILERFAALEAETEAGTYLSYRSVLARVVDGFGDQFGFEPTHAERDQLAESVPTWPPFDDTGPGLQALSRRFKLAVITNCDTDLFLASARHFPITFSEIVTAEQVGSYKPSRRNFDVALERLAVPRERILHVAQSLYHDIAPARALGLTTVWVNRRADMSGSGATPPSEARSDYEVRDLEGLVKLLSSAPTEPCRLSKRFPSPYR
jgi:2-haloacid dehalogenase